VRWGIRRYANYVVGEIKRLSSGRGNEERESDALDDS
jgi:hypothetical protein